MIRVIGFLFVIICFSCSAEPIAEWMSDDGLPEKFKSGLEQIRKNTCAPDSSDFSYPIYPNVEVLGVIFGRKKPDCLPRQEWEVSGASVALLSKDTYETVIEWYEKHLNGYHSFIWQGYTVFASDTISESEWKENHQIISSIMIKPTDKTLAMAGYKTAINLNNNPSNKSLKNGTAQSAAP